MLIVKVPGLNGLGKTKGCRNAGNKIIEGLDEVGSSEGGKPVEKKLLSFEEIHVNNENLEEQDKLIYENASEIFQEQDRVIFLGGDHSISFSIGRAFLDFCDKQEKKQAKEPCLIIFDAHADCCGGEGGGKAGKAGREPDHEEWLRALIEKGFPKDSVLLVGVRNLWQEEIIFLEKNKIKKISMNDLKNNLEETTDFIMEFARGKQIYISIDIDVLEPAIAPGTFHKEPGGLSSREIIYILQRLMLLKPKALDLVEVNPELDSEQLTVKLGAKILAEVL